MRSFVKKFLEEAYIAPIALSLFLVPLFWHPSFIYSFTQGKELLLKAVILITLSGLALSLIYKKSFTIKKITTSSLFLLLLLELVIFVVTDLLSNTPIVTLYGTYSRGFGFIMELFLFLFVMYCALGLSEEKITKLLKVAFFSAVLVSIYAILQKPGLNPFFWNYDTNIFAGRVFSFLGNPSYLGQFMLLQTLTGGYLTFVEKDNEARYSYLLGTTLAVIALFLSGTRTALLGLIIALLILGIKYAKFIYGHIKTHKKIVVGLVLVAGIIFAILPNDRYSLSALSMRSLNSRMQIWDGTIDLVKDHPIIGYGGETFYIHFPEIITKKFLTLEENTNISADRVHNETLEILFSHGIFAVVVYLAIFILLLKIFFRSKNKVAPILALIIIANIIQNQFAFPDITIATLIAFCFGGLVSLETKEEVAVKFSLRARAISAVVIFLICIVIGVVTIYRPFMSQLAYAKSKESYTVSYSTAVIKHKEALFYTPYYSELWYELMFIDPSSMERALHYLEQIDGNSGNVLAWKGNFYSKTDPAKASEFYTMALEKNPYHPNWIRAFADMLYSTGDYENALYLYEKYLDAVPDFWRWKDQLEDHTLKEQKSYNAFFKQSPDFWGVINKIEYITSILEADRKAFD